ncbi:MAG: hypothetical protein WCH65_07025 [bacterium]
MIEEYGKYKSVGNKDIHLDKAIDHQNMVINYGSDLFDILEINVSGEEDFEEMEIVLKDEKVIE